MDHKRILLLAVISLLSLTACTTSSSFATTTPTDGVAPESLTTVPATDTQISPTAIPATDTPAPPTETATSVPTNTPTGTEIPPTPIPEPYLPPNLEFITAGNIAKLQLIESLPVREIYDLAFSPSGNKLATLSEPPEDRFNDYMEVWDLTIGKQIINVDKWESPSGLFFTPDETRLYADNRIYDLANGTLVSTMEVVPQAFSPDGQSYVTGDYQGFPDESIIELVDLVTNTEVYSLTYPGMVMFLDFSPDGHLLTGGFQGNHFHVVAWDTSTWVEIANLIDYYSGLTFSPDGTLAATVKENRVYLFSADQMVWQASYGFSDPYANPYIKDFSPDGDILAIDDRYTIRFLVPLTGEELANLPDECELKFSPNGRFLVTWCSQSDLKIWGVMP